MKKILYIITILILYGCSTSSFDLINKSIIGSRKYIRNENSNQQLYRMDAFRKDFIKYTSKEFNLNLENRKDTLILIEYFDNICPNCSYYEIILLQDKYAFKIEDIDWKKKAFKHKLKVDTVTYLTHSKMVGDGLWKLKTSKLKKNPFDKALYSSHCFGGSKANITWILPNQNTISILADCIL